MNPLHRQDAEPTDAEIEAIVREAIAAEASSARRETKINTAPTRMGGAEMN